MRKILTLLLAFVFIATISITSFAAGSVKTVKTTKKISKIIGTVLVDKSGIKLKASKITYQLIGKTKGIEKSKGKAVQVSGYVENKKINVTSYVNILKCGTTVPTSEKPGTSTPPQKMPALNTAQLITLVGTLSESDVETLHYELDVKGEIYILMGDSTELKKFIGQAIKVTGYPFENQTSIFQKGILFSVKTVEVVGNTSSNTNVDPIKYETLVGTIVTDKKISDSFVGFKVDNLLYGLTGNVEGLKTLVGKKVEVNGYAPDIRYIREPDFTIFEVKFFKIID